MVSMEVVQPSAVHMVVDGKELQAQAGPGSLLEVLRQKGVVSVKHACGEGGCGACAVLVSEVDAHGHVSSRTVNSCLMPMYAADGCTITTADGLPHNAQGINPVAERLAGFYASQCGFCTPGMAVACHGTLAKAASQGRQATAAELRDGLDGNLCRCTGYRPIVDACKSFACDVDIEDLGYNAFTSQGQAFPEPVSLPPTHAAAPAGASTASTEMKVLHLAETQQTVYVPANLQQLRQVVSEHPSVRFVAGNTGTGVYKNWPRTEPVLAYIKQVEELQGIHVSAHGSNSACVRIGAAVTLAQVIDELTAWVRNSNKQQHGLVNGNADAAVLAAAPVWSEMSSHLKRVAGSHVRGAGTLVGNLVLTKHNNLPSDVATLMMAAGASMTLTDLKQSDSAKATQVMSLSEYLSNKDIAATQLVTHVIIPVPKAGTRFWSNRVATRYANSAAVINAAAMMPAGDGQPSFVLGMNLEHTHGPEKWRVLHCKAVEAALARATQPPTNMQLVMASLLPALSEDLIDLYGLPAFGLDVKKEAAINEQQQHYAYLHSAAEGLLLQAVTALLGNEPCARVSEPHSVLEGRQALSSDGSIAGTEGRGRHVLSNDGTPDHTEGRASPSNTSVATDRAPDTAAANIPDAANARPEATSSRTEASNGHAWGSAGEGSASSSFKPGLHAAMKLPPPAVVKGRQELLAVDVDMAPLTYAYPKESAKRQAEGTAQYTDDVPLREGALYGAYVLSTIAKGTVRHVDTTTALAAAGAVSFVGVEDIPGSAPPGKEPVFSHDIVYYGQPIGLMLGTSYQAALHAASLVRVEYDEQQPMLDPYEAVSKGSVYPLPDMLHGMEAGPISGSVRLGSVEAPAQVDASPVKLKGVRWHQPSQAHMYMEPQTAVAEVDEDKCVRIYSATQGLDYIQQVLCRHLALPQNKIEIRCRRVGGGFGGKVDHAARPAAAAAVAAIKTGKQVRLAVNRNQDMMLCGGRCEVDVEYDVGFDEQGRITALDAKAILSGGAFPTFTYLDCFIAASDGAYQIPHMHMVMNLAKLNLPPRTPTRPPGKFSAILFNEAVIDAVAAHLGMDPCDVRERNMRPMPPPGAPLENSFGMSLGNPEAYTLPRIWEELKASTGYAARQQAVKEFNASHTWTKRGLAMVPCSYTLGNWKKSAIVHIYLDGSVLLAHAGVDMGQGMGIKVMQTASYELSKLVPPSQRPLPLDLFKAADTSSYTLPHSGLDAGSATTMAACAAVRAACAELVSRIQPFTKDLGEDYTWQQLINKLEMIPGEGFRPLVDLTAHASAVLGDKDMPFVYPAYNTYGAVLTEVEIDVLTGDRRLKSVDILMDCGRSINPGVDLGQVEGAFVFGAGLMLGEAVLRDPNTGGVITNSTWRYKVPSVSCVPERFNITLLKDSPAPFEGPIGAKGVGEPPLLLSSSVASALTAAARAAASQVYGTPPPATQSLKLPALPQHIKHMCGTKPLQEVLKAM